LLISIGSICIPSGVGLIVASPTWLLGLPHFVRVDAHTPGAGIHSFRMTAINDAIRNRAQMHEVREFAGHANIRNPKLYFVRKEQDTEVAARRIRIGVFALSREKVQSRLKRP